MALTKIRGSSQVMDLSIGNAQIANGAGIELQKIEDGNLLVKSDGTVSFTAPIAGVAPVADSDLATKGYVDSVATGLDVKQSVRVKTTAPITLSGTQVIDGVTLVAGDRVLVTEQASGEDNGIYVVSETGWTRSTDADNSPAGEVTSGMFTFVEEGTQFGSTGWVLATANPISLGTTPLSFVQFSEAGQVSAGAGLVASGSTIDIVSANGGIVVNADNIALTVDPNGTLAVTAAGVKLADLTSGQILIGNASNVATAQTVSGDVTITNAGVVTIADDAVTQAKLADDSVGTLQIIDANVTLQKLETLDSAKIIIGTATGNQQVAVSGDATISETGVITVNATNVVKVADIVTRETPSGAIDGTNAIFTLANTPKVGTEHVYVNGLLMDEGAGNDYTVSGQVITLSFNLVAGDKIRVSYFK